MSDNNAGRSDDQMKCVYMGPPMRKNPFAALKEKFAGKGPEKKTYPKSFSDDRDPDSDPGMVDVYAGPGPEEPELEEVYMGPPLTDEPEEMPGKEPVPEKAAEPDLRAIEGVYAGPQVPPMAPVYAGPEMMSGPRDDAPRGMEGPRMEALYAAPRRPQPSEMMMVYAGPDFFSNGKYTQTPMMMAYAGPSTNMSMTMAEKMAAAQKEAEEWYRKEHPGNDFSKETQNPEDLGKETVCPGCGTKVLQSRFCSECGAALPGTLMVKCSCCGSIVRKGKFCIECGALFPQEESSPEA